MSKRILTMQDLSCVGQCSLTVALPILSAYGIETCVLPTAVLSNHTMFKSWSYLDLTYETENIFKHWQNNSFKFDAFLLGYLGKPEHMKIAEQCFDKFSAEEAKVIIDPVFGDNGKLYTGFDLNYVSEMRKLLKRADIILPNVTEACYLADIEYKQSHNWQFIDRLVNELKHITDGVIIITGVENEGIIGEIIYEGGKLSCLSFKKLPQSKHGTGDIFSSVFTANYLLGKTLNQSCALASEFVMDCIKGTDAEHFYGVNFERILRREL